MNRQRVANLHLSPVYIQQGLFAVLALLITLIGGQQFLRWEPVSYTHLTLPTNREV